MQNKAKGKCGRTSPNGWCVSYLDHTRPARGLKIHNSKGASADDGKSASRSATVTISSLDVRVEWSICSVSSFLVVRSPSFSAPSSTSKETEPLAPRSW